MNTYRIYFRHYKEILTVTAHHFSTSESSLTFYKTETEIDENIYIAFDAVGAIITENKTDDFIPSPVLVGKRSGSSKMGGF